VARDLLRRGKAGGAPMAQRDLAGTTRPAGPDVTWLGGSERGLAKPGLARLGRQQRGPRDCYVGTLSDTCANRRLMLLAEKQRAAASLGRPKFSVVEKGERERLQNAGIHLGMINASSAVSI
jgi:hypothetical protein